jgi:hypothetical protein
MRETESFNRLVDHACPLTPPALLVLLFWSLLSNHSLQFFDVRGLPTIIFLPLSLSTTFGRTKTFLIRQLYYIDRKWLLVNFHLLETKLALIYARLYMLTKTLQSLVA